MTGSHPWVIGDENVSGPHHVHRVFVDKVHYALGH